MHKQFRWENLKNLGVDISIIMRSVIYVNYIRCEDVDWIHLVQEKDGILQTCSEASGKLKLLLR
jgi:hypothetical protein